MRNDYNVESIKSIISSWSDDIDLEIEAKHRPDIFRKDGYPNAWVLRVLLKAYEKGEIMLADVPYGSSVPRESITTRHLDKLVSCNYLKRRIGPASSCNPERSSRESKIYSITGKGRDILKKMKSLPLVEIYKRSSTFNR